MRGRIDHLTTSRRQLPAKGQVACQFEELTIDSPRNRFVRAALETVARLVSQPALAHRCRGLGHPTDSALGPGPAGDRPDHPPQGLGDLELLICPVGREGGQQADAVAVDSEDGGG